MSILVYNPAGSTTITGLTDMSLAASGLGSVSNVLTVDMSGLIQNNETLTLTENISTVTLNNFSEGATLFLVVKNTSGGDLTITIPSGHWVDGGIGSSPVTIADGSRWLIQISFLDSTYFWTSAEMTQIV